MLEGICRLEQKPNSGETTITLCSINASPEGLMGEVQTVQRPITFFLCTCRWLRATFICSITIVRLAFCINALLLCSLPTKALNI